MTQIYFEKKINCRRPLYVTDNIKCENGKDVYLTSADAYRALAQRPKSRKDKKAVYHCLICGHYHLYSKDGATYRHKKYSRVRDEKIHGKKKFLVTDNLMRVARIIEDRRHYQVF